MLRGEGLSAVTKEKLADRFEAASANIDPRDARIAELEKRLEISPEAPAYDGIYCRDETIRMQDEIIDSARSRIAELEAALREMRADMNYAAMECMESELPRYIDRIDSLLTPL